MVSATPAAVPNSTEPSATSIARCKDRRFLTATQHMHQRSTQSGQGAHTQRIVTVPGGLVDRPTQTLQPGVDGPGSDRSAAGLELAHHRGTAFSWNCQPCGILPGVESRPQRGRGLDTQVVA